ncbi:MAG: T9SS type A sorting domain-containing protein [Bacteroidetes bacterium]|nr:T9SS type A sorting domain-containing protein [Bacteroidota bacterium]
MKKTLLLLSTAFLGAFSMNAQTAVNFNCNDCAGNNHDLFTELAAGKIIVITWVMPCGACISVASTASNTVAGYASSNPGVVKFYLTDDYANTSCATLTSWASTNSITTDATFSNASISMTDYGTAGMQKTVILAGANGTVYYNVNGTVNASAMQTAINNALATGINTNNSSFAQLNVYPNPSVGNSTTVSFDLAKTSDVTLDIFNVVGEKVETVSLAKETAGKHEVAVDLTTFNNGVYFVRLNDGKNSATTRMVIAN